MSAPNTIPAPGKSHAPHQHHERFKAGVRGAVTWLHRRAAGMVDPTATSILNSAATNLGWELARDAGSLEGAEGAPSGVAELRAEHLSELSHYADYCLEREEHGFARGEEAGRSDMRAMLSAAEAERDALRARVKVLEETLRPISVQASRFGDEWLDHETHWHTDIFGKLSIGDLRRATAALQASQSDQDGKEVDRG